jgi:hypothetical protein
MGEDDRVVGVGGHGNDVALLERAEVRGQLERPRKIPPVEAGGKGLELRFLPVHQDGLAEEAVGPDQACRDDGADIP